MAHVLEPIEDSFLHTAPLIIRSTVALPNSPEQVWEALGSDEMWSWFPAIDNLKWITPPGEAGCVRELRIGRFITVEEEFYRWEPNVRSTLRVTKASHTDIKALAEDFLLDAARVPCRTAEARQQARHRRHQEDPAAGLIGPCLPSATGWRQADTACQCRGRRVPSTPGVGANGTQWPA
ncbi:MAG TPA: SRPBCC family protein [Baekduia sp.]|nr:SRPBCC family protein [Baekduia sp.]